VCVMRRCVAMHCFALPGGCAAASCQSCCTQCTLLLLCAPRHADSTRLAGPHRADVPPSGARHLLHFVGRSARLPGDGVELLSLQARRATAALLLQFACCCRVRRAPPCSQAGCFRALLVSSLHTHIAAAAVPMMRAAAAYARTAVAAAGAQQRVDSPARLTAWCGLP
jgi:hypothetical protein